MHLVKPQHPSAWEQLHIQLRFGILPAGSVLCRWVCDLEECPAGVSTRHVTASDSAGLGHQEKARPTSFPGTAEETLYMRICLEYHKPVLFILNSLYPYINEFLFSVGCNSSSGLRQFIL